MGYPEGSICYSLGVICYLNSYVAGPGESNGLWVMRKLQFQHNVSARADSVSNNHKRSGIRQQGLVSEVKEVFKANSQTLLHVSVGERGMKEVRFTAHTPGGSKV